MTHIRRVSYDLSCSLPYHGHEVAGLRLNKVHYPEWVVKGFNLFRGIDYGLQPALGHSRQSVKSHCYG